MCLEGTPALLGNRKKNPVGAQGRLRSRVGSFPEARLVLGEVTEALCAAGDRTSSETDVGVAGVGKSGVGYSGIGLFRRFVSWRSIGQRFDSAVQLWVLSPGEPYPGRECLLGRTVSVC